MPPTVVLGRSVTDKVSIYQISILLSDLPHSTRKKKCCQTPRLRWIG